MRKVRRKVLNNASSTPLPHFFQMQRTTTTEIKKIGNLLVDSGKLIFCDPAYLRHWKEDTFEAHRAFRDTQTNQVYVYSEDFKHFDDILLDGKSVNDLIAENRLERVPYETSGEFSTSAVTKGIINQGYVQCNFPEGFEGMAIAIATPGGDGEVPVFAEFKDGILKKLWLEFKDEA